MTDWETELRELVSQIRQHEAVEDAWLAKSFTDRLLVVDVASDAGLPADVRELLEARDLRGSNAVYGTDGADDSHVGTVNGADRHRFVDLRTRGDHQSYVVE